MEPLFCKNNLGGLPSGLLAKSLYYEKMLCYVFLGGDAAQKHITQISLLFKEFGERTI